MNFIKQYLKIVNYSLIGLVFGFACFYILSNAYHYLEIRKDYIVDVDNERLTLEIENRLKNINENVSSFNANNYHGNISNTRMLLIYQNLNSCVNSFHNKIYKDIYSKNKITIIDVYNLRESYENNILNDCLVTNLHWTTSANDNLGSNYLANNSYLIKLHMNLLSNETSYLKKDLLNNSSYFYNTLISSSSIKDNTKDGFYEVMSAYNKAASFVEFISIWFKNEVEGNYD